VYTVAFLRGVGGILQDLSSKLYFPNILLTQTGVL
jgi:hypothetical protein